MTNLTLHFAPHSCALVTLIALEETGHPFDLELVALARGAQRQPGFLKLNPAGKVPVLVVDGQPMLENVAILAWLAGRFPERRLLPDPGDFHGRVAVLADLAYCAATLQSFAPRIRMPGRFCASDPDGVVAEAVKQARLQFDAVEARLAANEAAGGWWYGAEWSLVDAHLGWVWQAVSRPPGIDAASYPALTRHAQQGLARPAVQRALAREQAAAAELARRA